MRNTILFGLLFMATVISVGAQKPTGKTSIGRLHGSVYDKNLSYIPSTIVAECNGKKFEAEIGTNPYYSLDLPSGTCTMRAMPRDSYALSYFSTERAPVPVKAGKEQTINFYPSIRRAIISMLVTENRPHDVATIVLPPAYVPFQVSGDQSMEALIQFSERRVDGMGTEYIGAVLTFGNTTVIADTMLVDLNFSTFKLTGHLIVDANGKITKGTKGTVKNIDGNLVVSVR